MRQLEPYGSSMKAYGVIFHIDRYDMKGDAKYLVHADSEEEAVNKARYYAVKDGKYTLLSTVEVEDKGEAHDEEVGITENSKDDGTAS